MLERVAVPQSFERRNLVITGAFPGFQRQSWIEAESGAGQYVRCRRRLRMIDAVEAVDWDQFVVGVGRWRMAAGAGGARKYFLPARGLFIGLVRIRRRLCR